MAKKVSKNQRVNRGTNAASVPMAKIVISEKKENGEYRFRQKMVPQDRVQEELRAAKN